MEKRTSEPVLPEIESAVVEDARRVETEVRTGRLQRSMAIITGFAGLVSGFEAYTQHQRGAFSSRWMWTPVWLTPFVAAATAAAVASRRAARALLPVVSLASLVDGLIGFGYHLRGIARLPGGFKLGRYNVVIGPPVFAPLLMTSVGVLGLLASAFRREQLVKPPARPARAQRNGSLDGARPQPLTQEIAHGRFQQGMAVITAFFAVLAGGEAYFEHLRGSFNQLIMWTPVGLTPPMIGAAVGSVKSPQVARRVLPIVSAVTLLDGLLGFGLHLRGVKRMPGGFKNIAFNVTMGPPLFAPLLFCAVGLLGLIASLLRRE